MMGFLTSKSRFSVSGRTVLVTGGSQGLGLSIAKQLASKGANVVIIARDRKKLQTALQEISQTALSQKQRFHQLSFDLTDPLSATAIMEEVMSWNNGHPHDILFSCAGYCEPGFFASTSIKTHRSQMDAVYWSCAYMAHATLNVWTITKSGDSLPRHMVLTASIAAFLPMAGYAAYSPAKAAMRSLTDNISQEVAVYNGARSEGIPEIKVHAIFPMGILSPGYEREQMTKPKLLLMLEKHDKPQTPEEVAMASLHGLEAGQQRVARHVMESHWIYSYAVLRTRPWVKMSEMGKRKGTGCYDLASQTSQR